MSKDTEELHAENLILLFGTLVGEQVIVLMDDQSNSSIMHKPFIYKDRHLLKTIKNAVTIKHSNEEMVEEANKIVSMTTSK